MTQRPLLPAERQVFGEAAEVCEQTNFAYQNGSGAQSKAEQTAEFKKRLSDPLWVAAYCASDPNAEERHPDLFDHQKLAAALGDEEVAAQPSTERIAFLKSRLRALETK